MGGNTEQFKKKSREMMSALSVFIALWVLCFQKRFHVQILNVYFWVNCKHFCQSYQLRGGDTSSGWVGKEKVKEFEGKLN